MEQRIQHLADYTREAYCMNFFVHRLRGGEEVGEVHRHDFFQIILLEEGRARHMVDFRTQEMEPQSVSVVFPHQIHRLDLSPDARVTVVMFDQTVFCSEMLRNELKDYNIDLQRRINFPEGGQLPAAFDGLMALVGDITRTDRRMNPVRKMQIKLRIKIMLLEIIDSLPDAGECIANENDTVLYSRFCERVDRQFSEQRKVCQYAEELGVSSKKLTMVCQQYSGRSPLEIIHEKLTLELEKVLALDEMSFKEIAFRFGFSSQSALNKYIGQKFGMTPLEFKEHLQRRILGKK